MTDEPRSPAVEYWHRRHVALVAALEDVLARWVQRGPALPRGARVAVAACGDELRTVLGRAGGERP